MISESILEKIEEQQRSAVPSFEELKAQTREPKEHMCVTCINSYKEFNAKKRKADKNWEDVFPICKLTQDTTGTRKTGGLDETDATLDDWLAIGGTEDEYYTMRMVTDPVLWAASVLGVVTDGEDYDDDGDMIDMDRWYQRSFWRCSSMFKSYRAGRRLGKTFSMIVETLHFMWTNPGKRVLFIAPYEKQVIAFLEEIDKLVETSDLQFDHRSKSKHTFKLPNGSSLESVMTGGDKAGGGAKARGQKADLIIFDEACYVGPQDIEAALAILVDNRKCRVIASSTPTGKRDWFYKVSTDLGQGYKSFHLPSHASPAITKIADNQLRNSMSTAAYKQEILAEFGEEGSGVFSNADIDRSLREFSLKERRAQGPQPGCFYIVGADWNGRAIGNHVLVTEYDPRFKSYSLVDKVIIKDESHNVDNTCRVLIETWKMWKATYIYYDAGFGEAYESVLNKTAESWPALAKALVPIAMQGYQDVINPISKEVEKKPNKNFAINLLAARLEQGKIIMPFEEDYVGEGDDDWGLVHQMRKYYVDSVSASGRPIYGKTPDHTLVGFYLCILGFHMKMTSLGQANYDVYAGAHGKYAGRKEIDLSGGLNEKAEREGVTARDLEKMEKKKAAKYIDGAEDLPFISGGLSRLHEGNFSKTSMGTGNSSRGGRFGRRSF